MHTVVSYVAVSYLKKGHVDTTATIVSRTLDENSIRFLFQLPVGSTLMTYIIPKGYIAIDGTSYVSLHFCRLTDNIPQSLTVTSVSDIDLTFGIMLIAHSQTKVILAKKSVGDTVNIEVDMLGKYAEKAVIASFGGDSTIHGPAWDSLRAAVEKMVENTLKKHGL